MRLFLLALLLPACVGGAYLPPAVNVPALQQAGQATVSANARVFAPQLGAHAEAAVAITDMVRVAGTVSGRFNEGRGIYGEALVGVEPRLNKILQLGVLGGFGHGDVDAKHERCVDEGQVDGFCFTPGNHVDQVRATYARYSLQAHLIVRAPKIAHGGGGLRLSVLDMHVHELDSLAVRRHLLPVALEPFVFARLGAPFFQVELQMRYTGLMNAGRDLGRKIVVSDQFTFVAGIRIVFGPGIRSRWPHGWRYD